MQKREAFTMIELIFVIVILGILAAVAIPKISATRDDANVARSLSEMGISLADFSSFYTASGSFGKVSDMTRVIFDDMTKDLKSGGSIGFLTAKAGGTESCASFVFTSDGNITISSASASGTVCKNLQATDMFKKLSKTHQVGGERVKF